MAQSNLGSGLQKSLNVDRSLSRGSVSNWEREASRSLYTSIWQSSNTSDRQSSSASSTQSLNTGKSQDVNARKNLNSVTSDKVKRSAANKKKIPKLPTGGCGDRFIPSRSAMQFDIAKYMLSQNGENNEILSPNSARYRAAVSESLNLGDLSKRPIMAYQKKDPLALTGHADQLKIYNSSENPFAQKSRHIPRNHWRTLDAPEIVDDYHLNLIDWSSTDLLAVALGEKVYIWNASNSDIQLLLELPDSEDYITSVSWVKGANCLAVGTSTAEVQIWDVDADKRIRMLDSHTSRVPSLAWNGCVLSTGDYSGQILHHDARVARHQVGTFSGHSREVCGLQWSPDGRYLASGGADNILNIWRSDISGSQARPLYVKNEHRATVKAVSWCPWQKSVLATGGGTGDQHIRLWNCNTGTCLNSVDTKSQVCGILWSTEYKELISGHGFPNHELNLWKYPEVTKVAELTEHTARILSIAASPDGTTVASAGADETLRLWRCFSVDSKKRKNKKTTRKNELLTNEYSLMRGVIR